MIRPQNMLLAAVNFCLFCVGAIQCTRIVNYNIELTGSAGGAYKKLKGEMMGSAKEVEAEAKKDLKAVEQKVVA